MCPLPSRDCVHAAALLTRGLHAALLTSGAHGQRRCPRACVMLAAIAAAAHLWGTTEGEVKGCGRRGQQRGEGEGEEKKRVEEHFSTQIRPKLLVLVSDVRSPISDAGRLLTVAAAEEKEEDKVDWSTVANSGQH
ncbi:hypothetical protein GW17_00053317 [Ensete ventricosum]|nr:hypothetical protein GW17_00053317 [Ensete ventricosum]